MLDFISTSVFTIGADTYGEALAIAGVFASRRARALRRRTGRRSCVVAIGSLLQSGGRRRSYAVRRCA